MITIKGRQYRGINNQRLENWFGPHYIWTETFYNYIRERVEDDNPFNFNSVNNIVLSYLDSVRNRFQYPPLTNISAHLYGGSTRHRIAMTGSGNQDIANLMREPDGYTWHHAENIFYENSRLYCYMYLVESEYHSKNRHCGGVNEYKWIYIVGYR